MLYKTLEVSLPPHNHLQEMHIKVLPKSKECQFATTSVSSYSSLPHSVIHPSVPLTSQPLNKASFDVDATYFILITANLHFNLESIKQMESDIDKMTSELPPLSNFILPVSMHLLTVTLIVNTMLHRSATLIVKFGLISSGCFVFILV